MDYVVGSIAALISGNVTPNRPKLIRRALTPTKHPVSPNVTPKSEAVEDRSLILSPSVQKKKAIVKKSPKRIFENPDLDITEKNETTSPKADKVKKHLQEELEADTMAKSSLSKKSPSNKLDKSVEIGSPNKKSKINDSQASNENTPKKRKRNSESVTNNEEKTTEVAKDSKNPKKTPKQGNDNDKQTYISMAAKSNLQTPKKKNRKSESVPTVEKMEVDQTVKGSRSPKKKLILESADVINKENHVEATEVSKDNNFAQQANNKKNKNKKNKAASQEESKNIQNINTKPTVKDASVVKFETKTSKKNKNRKNKKKKARLEAKQLRQKDAPANVDKIDSKDDEEPAKVTQNELKTKAIDAIESDDEDDNGSGDEDNNESSDDKVIRSNDLIVHGNESDDDSDSESDDEDDNESGDEKIMGSNDVVDGIESEDDGDSESDDDEDDADDSETEEVSNIANPNAITEKDSDSEHDSDNEIDSDIETSNKEALQTEPAGDESSDDDEKPTKKGKKGKEAKEGKKVKERKEVKEDEGTKEGKKGEEETKEATEEEIKRTLFVGNVPFSNKCKKEIKKIFAKYGEIETVRIRTVPVKDARVTPKLAVIRNEIHPERSTVNVYVKFADADSVTLALAENNTKLDHHHLRVTRSSATGVEHNPDHAVFLGNLPFGIEDETLRAKFESCGEIQSVRIVRDKKTNAGKGFGYVNFASQDGVELALGLSEEDLTVKNRIIRVKRCTQTLSKGKKVNQSVKPQGNFGNNQNRNFGNNQGNNRNFGNNQAQNRNFGNNQAQNRNFGNNEAQNRNFGNNQAQNRNFGNNQAHNRNFGNNQAQNRNFGNNQAQSRNFGNNHGQNRNFGGNQGNPPNRNFGNNQRNASQGNRQRSFGDSRGPNRNFGNNQGPGRHFGNDQGNDASGASRRIMNKRPHQENGDGPPQKRQNVDLPPREKKQKKEFVGITAEKKKKQKFDKGQKKKKAISEIMTKKS